MLTEFVWGLLGLLLGLGIGSFLNVVVLRLNARKTLGGRSCCPQCKKTLPWFTLIPVVSYIALGGQCWFCKKPIAVHYPLVELVTGLLFMLLAWSFASDPIRLVLYAIMVALCLAIFLSDYLFYTIPDALTLPGIILGIIGQLALGEPWWRLGLALAIGGGVFALQHVMSRGRWVGSGDIRFGLLMGAALSWPNIVVGLFLAYVLGGITVLPMLLQRQKTLKDAVPFGTFLAVATILTLFTGDTLVQWYIYDLLRLPN